MATPLQFVPNTNCDIVHNDTTHVDGVKCQLIANYLRHTESGEKDPMGTRYTHILILPLGTDIRDEYDAGVQAGGQDTVYIPAGNHTTATPFTVRFVETKGRGGPFSYIKAYLDRGTPPWPTQNL